MKVKGLALAAVMLPGLILAAGCAKKATHEGQPAGMTNPIDRGARLFEEGKYEEARAQFNEVLEADSSDVDAVVYLGRIALRQEDHDEAIRWVERALALAPDSSSVHYWAAMAYVVKLQKDQALDLLGNVTEHINTAVELDSSNVDARLFLAGFLLNAPPFAGGSVDKAKEQADIIVGYDPYRGRLFWAEIFKKEKKFDEAAGAYRAAAAIDPDSPEPYFLLGMMYQGIESYGDAFAAFESALKVDPEANNALYQIGKTGAVSGENLDRAIAALESYLQTAPAPGQPTVGNAHWRLGMCYEQKGNVEKARTHFERALALDPDDDNARKSLEQLDEAGGRL